MSGLLITLAALFIAGWAFVVWAVLRGATMQERDADAQAEDFERWEQDE